MHSVRLPSLFSIVAALACSSALAAPVTQGRLDGAQDDASNWLTHGRDYAETRFSPLEQIDDQNVDQLGLAWSFDLHARRGLESTPLVVDGVMYVTGAWSTVFALDARNGQLRWRFDPRVSRSIGWKACCDVVNRGVAAYGDKIFVGALDGRLIALDAHDGHPVWEVQTTDPNEPRSITGAPRVMNGKVVIGNGGAEFGVRGYVSAYSADTGEMLWRFHTVPGNPADGFEDETQAMAAGTWTGEWWKLGGGGTVWDSMAYDPDSNLLYIGVGNGSPHNRRLRSPQGGDNLFLSSIVALDADTGRHVWHYQETPAESWDYTATQQITIADIDWQRTKRRVLLHAPKNGFFFVIDAASGALLSAEKYVPVTWASGYDLSTGRPIERAGQDVEPETMLFPSPAGGHNWQSMAYSPRTGLVYIPANHFGINMRWRDQLEGYRRSFNLGWDGGGEPPDDHLLLQAFLRALQKGYLKAWDPQTQTERWRVEYPLAGNGGVLATAGNLVFQGDLQGTFHAYAADSGRSLWDVSVPNVIVAAPVTYRVDGEQYVAIEVGSGGGALLAVGLDMPNAREPGRVLAFKLGGEAPLPLPSAAPPIPAPPPRVDIADSERSRAKAIYSDHCIRCHGTNGVTNLQVPDLRRLAPASHEAFEQVVLGGLRKDAGMPPFDDVLNAGDVRILHAWLIDLAWQDEALRSTPDWQVELKSWFYEKIAAVVAWWMQRGLEAKTAAERI